MRAAVLALLAAVLALPACQYQERLQPAASVHGGDPDRGKDAVRRYGCVTCHTIPGVTGADALVGPPLDRMASRVYIAGVLVNTPDNMVKWLHDPPAVDALTAMPNVGADDEDVRDIASFLYTLK